MQPTRWGVVVLAALLLACLIPAVVGAEDLATVDIWYVDPGHGPNEQLLENIDTISHYVEAGMTGARPIAYVLGPDAIVADFGLKEIQDLLDSGFDAAKAIAKVATSRKPTYRAVAVPLGVMRSGVSTAGSPASVSKQIASVVERRWLDSLLFSPLGKRITKDDISSGRVYKCLE
jgi:hypothetical protein